MTDAWRRTTSKRNGGSSPHDHRGDRSGHPARRLPADRRPPHRSAHRLGGVRARRRHRGLLRRVAHQRRRGRAWRGLPVLGPPRRPVRRWPSRWHHPVRQRRRRPPRRSPVLRRVRAARQPARHRRAWLRARAHQRPAPPARPALLGRHPPLHRRHHGGEPVADRPHPPVVREARPCPGVRHRQRSRTALGGAGLRRLRGVRGHPRRGRGRRTHRSARVATRPRGSVRPGLPVRPAHVHLGAAVPAA